MTNGEGKVKLSVLLAAAEDASPVDAVSAVTRELGVQFGATAVSFLIADMSGRALVRLAHLEFGEVAPGATEDEAESRHAGRETATVLPFDGGPTEQALISQQVQVVAPAAAGAPWSVIAPVTERGESLGLLQLSLPHEPAPDLLVEIARTAHVLSFVVIANRRHTDLFEWGQRSTPFTLSAEIQRRLLPGPFTCEAGSFTLSAWLEPAASVGGDTFDYSLTRDDLFLSMTDAMGHGVASALTATLCVGSLRNSRRAGSTLLEQADAANAALVQHASDNSGESFVTGVIGRLDLRTGVLALVNAGHVAPVLHRDGSADPVALRPRLPLGMFPNTQYVSEELRLLPGDRLVFVTDGMLERNAADLDLPALIRQTRSQHPREATRYLADRVLELTGGTLADDATLLILDWHGSHGQPRTSDAGADPV